MKNRSSVNTLKCNQPAEPCMEAGNPRELVQSPTAVVEPSQADVDKMRAELGKVICKMVGVRDINFANLLMTQMSTLQLDGLAKDNVHLIHQAAAALREIDPQNAAEAMLAVQMFGVHNAAVMFLQRATRCENVAATDANVLRATRLMRLFNEQLGAMAKLKGKTRRSLWSMCMCTPVAKPWSD